MIPSGDDHQQSYSTSTTDIVRSILYRIMQFSSRTHSAMRLCARRDDDYEIIDYRIRQPFQVSSYSVNLMNELSFFC
jgi:hypothetical protein